MISTTMDMSLLLSEWRYTLTVFVPSEASSSPIDRAQLPLPTAASAICPDETEKAKLIDCDIRIISSVKLYEGTGNVPSDAYDVISVAVHEFGHGVGLADQPAGDDAASVMNPDIGKGQKRRSLSADDVAGRDALFP